jgi:hypothetical protein
MPKSSERIGSSGSRGELVVVPVRPRRMESFRIAFLLGQIGTIGAAAAVIAPEISCC